MSLDTVFFPILLKWRKVPERLCETDELSASWEASCVFLFKTWSHCVA